MKTTVILQCSACTYRSILRNELTIDILQCSARKRKARNDDYEISFQFTSYLKKVLQSLGGSKLRTDRQAITINLRLFSFHQNEEFITKQIFLFLNLRTHLIQY